MAKPATKSLIRNTLLGGVIVLLPVGIMLFIAKWLFRVITDLIQPITNLIIKSNGLPEIIGDIAALSILCAICFFIGFLVTTSAGRWFHSRFDTVLARAPGYRIVKEIVAQFLGNNDDSPFQNGEVCLVQIYGENNPILVTAIITSRSDDYATVMFPTCPNPSSGLGYHVPWNLVTLRPDINLDSAIRTIIACGAGSSKLFGWPSTNH